MIWLNALTAVALGLGAWQSFKTTGAKSGGRSPR
jgi:hypothetical protein